MVHSESETESEYFEESDDDLSPRVHGTDARGVVVHVHAACASEAALQAAQQPHPSADPIHFNTHPGAALLHTQAAPPTTKLKRELDVASRQAASSVSAKSLVSPLAPIAVKTEPFASEWMHENQSPAMKNCAQCDAPLRFESSYKADVATSFCLCCKRPVVTSGLPMPPPSQRMVWRCPECVSPPRGHSDDLLAQLVAALPERVQHADTITKAVVAITQKLNRFRKSNLNYDRLFTSLPLQQIDQAYQQHRETERAQRNARELAIQQGTMSRIDVFDQWIQTKDRLLELAVKKVVLCSELFESYGYTLPESVSHFLASTGMSSVASREEPMRCDSCDATLKLPAAAPESTPAFCDCCRRMVPLTLMANTPSASSEKSSLLCRACHASTGDQQAQRQLLNDRVDAKWIQTLASVADSLRSKILSSKSNLCVVDTAIGESSTDQEIEHWRKTTRALHRRHYDTIRLGATRMCTSQQLYKDQVELDQGLLKSHEKLVIERVNRMAALQIILPVHAQAVVRKVYVDNGIQVPEGLFEERLEELQPAKSMSLHGQELHQPDEQLPPVPKAPRSFGFCDGCKRVLPAASIVQMSRDACVATCRTCCSTRSHESLYHGNDLKKRLAPHQIDCFSQVLGLLRRSLEEVGSASAPESPDTLRRVSAEQTFKSCRARLAKLNDRIDKAVQRGEPPVVDVQLSQQLYADHMEVSDATAQSALDLVQILLETMATPEIASSAEIQRLLAKLQIGSVATGVSRSDARKRNGIDAECQELLTGSLSQKKRPRLTNNREREPGESSGE